MHPVSSVVADDSLSDWILLLFLWPRLARLVDGGDHGAPALRQSAKDAHEAHGGAGVLARRWLRGGREATYGRNRSASADSSAASSNIQACNKQHEEQ